MLMGGDVCGDWEIEFFHSMKGYALTMNNCRKVPEVSNEGVYWMLPQFQKIKDTSVDFTINKMLQGCVTNVGGF